MSVSFDVILILATIRIIASLVTTLFALSLYKLFKGGLIAQAWPFLVIAAILQAIAALGAIIGEVTEVVLDIFSVFALFWFTFKLRNSWRKLQEARLSDE